MKIVFFGGGAAGRIAFASLIENHGHAIAGKVWDADTGAPPDDNFRFFEDIIDDTVSGDVLICSGYGHKISAETLQRFSLGAYNAHPSLLPAYRGRHAIQWAICEGEKILGVTLHRMSSNWDEGDIVLFRGKRFGVARSYSEIADELAHIAADMLVEFINDLLRGYIPASTSCQGTQGPYWRRRTPEDNRISWTDSAIEVLDAVRSTASHYPPYAFQKNGTKVIFVNYLASDVPGQVLFSSDEGCLIATTDGVIWLVPDRPLQVGDILT